jgi:hypothetical protein
VDQSYCFALALPFLGGAVGLLHTPPEQLPLPFIIPAEASVVKVGVGIDKLKIANAKEANAAIIHFIDHPP